MTEQTTMLATYSIGDGDFTELACQSCAENFADDMGLTWNDSVTHTIDDAKAYATWEPYGETDSVATCSACHAILDMSLTQDGLAWLRENRDGFPAFVLEYYRID